MYLSRKLRFSPLTGTTVLDLSRVLARVGLGVGPLEIVGNGENLGKYDSEIFYTFLKPRDTFCRPGIFFSNPRDTFLYPSHVTDNRVFMRTTKMV